jgi:hypothetical protein
MRVKRSGIATRVISAALLLAQGACLTAPRAVSGPPAAYLQAHSPKRIWVTLANGEAMVIDAPRVFGDSLLGFTDRGGGREEVWLPVSDVQEVRTRKVSGGKTALLGGLVVGALGLVVVMIPTGGGEHVRQCTNEGEPCENP